MSALLALMLLLSPAARAQEPPVNADAHWNQGVQALESGREDLAVLAFRRGLMLRPHDGALKAQLAQRQAHPDSPPLLAPDRAGWTGVLLLSLAGFSLLIGRIQGRRELLVAALSLAPLGAALGLQAQLQVSGWGERALVLAPGAVLTAQPSGGLTLFELPPHSEVTLGPTVDGAVQVQTLDGRRGWTSEDALGVLDPRVFTAPTQPAR